MECTLHGAVKLNMITGFSKAVDNLLVIKNPSRCAVCLRWSLLLPEHKNSVNTNPGHRRMFQTVDTHRPGPGPLQLLFISSGLTALILHNVGGFGCGFFFFLKWVFIPIHQGLPCFVQNDGLPAVVAGSVFSHWLFHLCRLENMLMGIILSFTGALGNTPLYIGSFSTVSKQISVPARCHQWHKPVALWLLGAALHVIKGQSR